MRKLERWGIGTTLRAVRETTALASGACIGINLSPHSLSDDKLAAFLLEEIEACSLQPRQVCFEIAETVAVQHFVRVSRFVSAARDLGCRIALDDFGGGLAGGRRRGGRAGGGGGGAGRRSGGGGGGGSGGAV